MVGAWNTIFGYLVFLLLNEAFSLFLSPRYVAYMTASLLGNVLAITMSSPFFFTSILRLSQRRQDGTPSGSISVLPALIFLASF